MLKENKKGQTDENIYILFKRKIKQEKEDTSTDRRYLRSNLVNNTTNEILIDGSIKGKNKSEYGHKLGFHH